jgi:U3 small nucleolar RNA-associated protein MPP10
MRDAYQEEEGEEVDEESDDEEYEASVEAGVPDELGDAEEEDEEEGYEDDEGQEEEDDEEEEENEAEVDDHEEDEEEEEDPQQLEAFLQEMDNQEDLGRLQSLEEREAEEVDAPNPPLTRRPKVTAVEEAIGDPETLFQNLAYGTDARNLDRIEKNLIGKKGWALQGEVRGSQRPQDGLLDAEVDFDVGLQSKVVISQVLNQKFESIIRQRIQDGAFDDREFPKPTRLSRNQTGQYEDLDFEKDRRGLAGVYEDEYRRDVLGSDPQKTKADQLKESISSLFRSLCFSIDQMSRANFTPTTANLGFGTRPEAQLITEEKIPVIVTGNLVDNRKSFREVHNPDQADFKATGEMGKDERKAVRRKIKEARHRISLRIKEENRVKSGLSTKDAKLLDKNKAKIEKKIRDSKVTPAREVKPSTFFGTLEGLKRVKQV